MSKYILYTSSVSANVLSVKQTTLIINILNAHKIPFEEIDISLDVNDAHKQIMISKSKAKLPRATPQLFKDGEYVADYPTVDEWNEYGEIAQHLKA